MAKQGVELITVLSAGTRQIQVGRQPNPSSIDAIYIAKKQVADQVNAQGMELMGKKFVKYTVEKISLTNNKEAILGYAEDSLGNTGINYAIPANGYEYAVAFIYETASDAVADASARKQLINSIEFS